MFKRLKAV